MRLTSQQIEQIVNIINGQLNQAKEHVKALDELCYPNYLHGREKHPTTGIVYSGFIPETSVVTGFHIQEVIYGKNRLSLPELYNHECFIQLYSDGAKSITNQEVKQKVEALGSRFHIIVFSIDKVRYCLSKLKWISFTGENVGDKPQTAGEITIYSMHTP